MSDKPKDYDYTKKERTQRFREKVKAAGLKRLDIIGHPDDAKAIREYARKRYEKRGIHLD